MALLLAGIALWWGAHLFKRVAPGPRAAMGDKAKGLVAILLVLSIVLMTLGHRSTDFIPVWNPPSFFGHINNLLMVVSFYIFGVGATKGVASAKIRHPQLTAVKLWAVAHLLANGDLSSMILFGSFLAWAVVSVIILNRANGPWERPTNVSVKGDVKAMVVGLVLVVVAMVIHIWLGLYPIGGL